MVDLGSGFATAQDQLMHALAECEGLWYKLIGCVCPGSAPANKSLFDAAGRAHVPNHDRCSRFGIDINEERVTPYRRTVDTGYDAIVCSNIDIKSVYRPAAKGGIDSFD